MKFLWNGKELFINNLLARQLNTIAYNVRKDWDFVLMLSGDRTVRVGKSVLAQVIAAYLSYVLTNMGLNSTFSLEDIYFDNVKMMECAFKKPKYSINLFDEARSGLASNKSMQTMQKDLLDFFAECGQLNQIFIIVAPDFFKLNEEIAVARSEYLINVYRRDTPIVANVKGEEMKVMRYDRGFFEFFDRKKKQNLYDKSMSTRRRNYGLIKCNFLGNFSNQYPVGEEEYRAKKRESLSRFKEKREKEAEPNARKVDIVRDRIIWNLRKETPGITGVKIARYLELNYDYQIRPESVLRILKKQGGKCPEPL